MGRAQDRRTGGSSSAFLGRAILVASIARRAPGRVSPRAG
jgi:hypothetical protein